MVRRTTGAYGTLSPMRAVMTTNRTRSTPAATGAQRPSRKPSMLLQPRDLQVLETLVLSRCMSTTQLGRLFFPLHDGSISPRARLRLAQMAKAGLVRSIEQPSTRTAGAKANVHFPTDKGRLLVASELGHDPRVLPAVASPESSWSFLEHTLLCNEVRVLATLGAAKTGITLAHWLPDYALRKLHMRHTILPQADAEERPATIVPDSQWEVEHGASHHRFFLEADRGTIPAISNKRHRDWRSRVGLYLAAERSGVMQDLYGGHHFRVLTVVPNRGRLESLKAATEEVGGKGRFWFVVRDELTAESFYTGKIWTVAGKPGQFSLLW